MAIYHSKSCYNINHIIECVCVCVCLPHMGIGVSPKKSQTLGDSHAPLYGRKCIDYTDFNYPPLHLSNVIHKADTAERCVLQV